MDLHPEKHIINATETKAAKTTDPMIVVVFTQTSAYINKLNVGQYNQIFCNRFLLDLHPGKHIINATETKVAKTTDRMIAVVYTQTSNMANITKSSVTDSYWTCILGNI